MLHYSDKWTMIYKSKASYTIAVKRTRNWTGFPTTVHIQGVSYTGHVKAIKKMWKTTPETTCKSIKRHKDSNNNNILSVNCTQHIHFLYQTKTCHRHWPLKQLHVLALRITTQNRATRYPINRARRLLRCVISSSLGSCDFPYLWIH